MAPVCVAAWLFLVQQQLQPNTVSALRKAVPELTEADVQAMMRAPMRSYDPTIMQVRPAASCHLQCAQSAVDIPVTAGHALEKQ
jgi:hypothetical protein